MYKVCSKLKLLKARLKLLNKNSFSDISSRTEQARNELFTVQMALELRPFDQNLLDSEAELLRTYSSLRLQEESFFRQKSRIRWLKEGDSNTKFFHHFVNKRCAQNHILSVSTNEGNILSDPVEIRNHIVSHFQVLLNGDAASSQRI